MALPSTPSLAANASLTDALAKPRGCELALIAVGTLEKRRAAAVEALATSTYVACVEAEARQCNPRVAPKPNTAWLLGREATNSMCARSAGPE